MRYPNPRSKINLPYPRWRVTAFVKANLSLPNGPIGLVSTWSINPYDDQSKSPIPIPLVQNVEPIFHASTPKEPAIIQIVGSISSKKAEANNIAIQEVSKLISLLSVISFRSIGPLQAITLQGHTIKKQPVSIGRRKVLVFGEEEFDIPLSYQIEANVGAITPLTDKEIAEYKTAYDKLCNARNADALLLAMVWLQRALFSFDSASRFLFSWTASEVLAQIVVEENRQIRNCPECSKPLHCRECDRGISGVGRALKEMFVTRYHVLGSKEYDTVSTTRNRIVHGGRGAIAILSNNELKDISNDLMTAIRKIIIRALEELSSGE